MGGGLHVKEQDEINFLSFSQKKNILEMISKYDSMRYKFSYLVNESVLLLFSLIRYSPTLFT